MLALWNWLTHELAGTKWLWRIIVAVPLLLLSASAPLNWTDEKTTMVQVTTASTSRTTTTPSNAVLLATGSATNKMRIFGLEIQPTAAITAATSIFIWLSNDGGTTKYYLDEYPIGPFDISAQFKRPPHFSWTFKKYVPLSGTNDKLYATIYTTDTVNVGPNQVTY